MAASEHLPVAIVGAGVTGLAAAYELSKRGRSVRLFEAADHVGGLVQTERDDSWLIEAGPTALHENSPQIRSLIAELGLEPHKRYARTLARNRYVLRGGRAVAAPITPGGLLTTRLFSLPAKLRILAELRKRPRARSEDLSLTEFVRSHFGREAVDYGLSPLVAGVYAGDPEKLSSRHALPVLWRAEHTHGSILRVLIAADRAKRAQGADPGPPPIVSFAEGLSTLTRALAYRLPPTSIHLEATVDGLATDGGWRILRSDGASARAEAFSHVILALPAASLARLRIGGAGERPLAELSAIEHPPLASLFLGYRRDQVRHPLDGYGLLVPHREQRRILGVLFSSSLFPGRAPEGHVALTVLAGGATRPDLGLAPLSQLLPVVQPELAEILGVTGDPVYLKHNGWTRAIPQYNLGYNRFLDAMNRCEAEHPGVLIGGQVRDGIGLPLCLAAGRRLAQRVLDGD